MVLIQFLVQLASTSPYFLVIIYYLIKQGIKIFITALSEKRMDLPYHIFEMGPDLCFMGFTLFAAAISGNAAKINKFSNPGLAIFFYTIFLVALYALSYATMQEFKRIGKLPGSGVFSIYSHDLDGKGVKLLRTGYLVTSLFLGATAFGIVVELVR